MWISRRWEFSGEGNRQPTGKKATTCFVSNSLPLWFHKYSVKHTWCHWISCGGHMRLSFLLCHCGWRSCVSYLLPRGKRLPNVVTFLSHSLDLAQFEGLSWKVLVQSLVLSRLDGGRRPRFLTTWPVHQTAFNRLPPQRGVREREGTQSASGQSRRSQGGRHTKVQTPGDHWAILAAVGREARVGEGGMGREPR